MILTRQHLLALLITCALIILVSLLFNNTQNAKASAPTGLPATIATSTAPTVTGNSATVLIASSSCSARIISTGQTTIMLTFNDAFTPTGTFGVYQAASTTVVYDSGQFGCGQVKGLTNATGVVTVMDVR